MGYLHDSPNSSLYSSPVTHLETENYLKSLKMSSAGFDKIPPHVLKYTVSSISLPLTHIINLSFKKGVFPDELKKANVVPIFKSGNINYLNNYRPISVFAAFSKVFEKGLVTHIVNFFEKIIYLLTISNALDQDVLLNLQYMYYNSLLMFIDV